MKELDPETTEILQWIENIAKPCRLHHVVVWIGGCEVEAAQWATRNEVRVAVIPADSSDLSAWNIDPQFRCSVVFLEQKMAIGGLGNIGTRGEADFRQRVKELGASALEMKHGHARMWGRVVGRGLTVEPEQPDPRK